MAQVTAEANSIDLVGLQLSTKSDVIYKFLKEGNLQEAYNLLIGEYHLILMRSNYLKLIYILLLVFIICL